MGKQRSPSAQPGGAVVGGSRGLTGRGCYQWRGSGGGRAREARGTRVNGPLCERGMNGGLCEGRRRGGSWRPECLGPPGTGGQESREREFTFCRMPTAYQALSQELTHRGGVGDTGSNNNNNDLILSARCMPGAVLSALPA